MTLLLAGHETTAASLSWAFERALRHGDVWESMRAEARRGDGTAYTAAVVSETLRTRPVLWLAGRTLLADRRIDGYTLPAGSLAYVCGYLLHRREDIYPDALAFRPERFLGTERGAYTFVPFGGGARRCIGAAFAELEMRAVLAAIASTCDLRAVDAGRDSASAGAASSSLPTAARGSSSPGNHVSAGERRAAGAEPGFRPKVRVWQR